MYEKFHNSSPNPADNIVPTFKTSTPSVEKQNVYDAKGKIVSTKRVRRSVCVPLPADELENKGYSCDLFTVENLKQAGQDPYKMTPTTQKLFGGDLDSVGQVRDSLDNFDYSQLTEQDFDDPAPIN